MHNFIDNLHNEIWGILGLTLRMTISSTLISSVLGIPVGLWLARTKFWGKNALLHLVRTLMATPPVVMGALTWILLRREGVLGHLGWMFSLNAMILAQVLLIFPVVVGLVHLAASRNAENIRNFGITMGASRWQGFVLLMREMSNEIFFVIITAFGRAMAEVGAIMMVGGNMRGHTRTMTTSISMLNNFGALDSVLFLGGILLLVAFLVQFLANLARKREARTDENF